MSSILFLCVIPAQAGIQKEIKKMQEKTYYIYILASQKNGTLYTGVTNNLLERINQHKNKVIKGFTEKYNVNQLVYYEVFHDIHAALNREKQLKTWKRAWKLKLIEDFNPGWRDLYGDLNN